MPNYDPRRNPLVYAAPERFTAFKRKLDAPTKDPTATDSGCMGGQGRDAKNVADCGITTLEMVLAVMIVAAVFGLVMYLVS